MGASIVALALHVLLVCCRANAAARSSDASRLLNVVTRQQRQQPTGRHRWDVVEQSEQWEAARTAFVVVDMWNDHPCLSATFRIHGLAGPMEQVLSAARSAGVSVIHAPSGCGTSMAHLPARQYVLNLTNQPLPSSHPHETPPFPLVVNGSQAECGPPEMKSEMCGCDGTWRVGGSWPKTVYCPQLSTLTVDDRDAVVEDDGGQQIFNVLTDRNITNIVYMGVHENMCIMGRSFAIRQTVGWGFKVALMRDLVDTMYSPFDPPYVSHDLGNEIMTGFIEKFWAPSISFYDFLEPGHPTRSDL